VSSDELDDLDDVIIAYLLDGRRRLAVSTSP
jgi:hypothetical protein